MGVSNRTASASRWWRQRVAARSADVTDQGVPMRVAVLRAKGKVGATMVQAVQDATT
jgi:hypothetical protein